MKTQYSGITLFCCTFLLVWVAGAMAEEEKKVPDPVQVTEHLYMIGGDAGNVGVFTGEDGTFVIDDQFAPLSEALLDAIRSVGGDIPRFLINTHYHFDHTGGNENMGKQGSLIFSHDNVRERLSVGSFLSSFKMKQEAISPEGLPIVTFSDNLTFHLNGDTLRAVHVPSAHTDGDSFIFFTKENVIHTGDIFFNGFYPFVDVDHGGSLRGMITAADTILQLADDSTKIIPGHGPVATKEDLTAYRKMLMTAYERLRKLKIAGKTAQEAVEAKPLADLDEKWAGGLFSSDKWIELIYPGVY